MTIIKEVLKKFKWETCKEETKIKSLELFTEFNPDSKKVSFYVYCEQCKTAQGIEIHKPARVEDYLLAPIVGAG